jgi:hypothetical protein
LKQWRGRSRASLLLAARATLAAGEISGSAPPAGSAREVPPGISATISSQICQDANILQRMTAHTLAGCSAWRRTLLKQSWTGRHTVAEIVCIASQNHYRKGAWRVQSSFPTAFSTEPWKRPVDLASRPSLSHLRYAISALHTLDTALRAYYNRRGMLVGTLRRRIM